MGIHVNVPGSEISCFLGFVLNFICTCVLVDGLPHQNQQLACEGKEPGDQVSSICSLLTVPF